MVGGFTDGSQFEKLSAVSDRSIGECVQAFVDLVLAGAPVCPKGSSSPATAGEEASRDPAETRAPPGFTQGSRMGRGRECAAIACDPKAGSPLSRDEMSALRSIVIESGGFRMIQQCVRHWERLETWARSQNIQAIPLTTEVLVKYLLDLSDRGCGPTVIPSVRGAVKWICKRIGKKGPDLLDARIMALQKKVYGDRGKGKREAVPYPWLWWPRSSVRPRAPRRARDARDEGRGSLRSGLAD